MRKIALAFALVLTTLSSLAQASGPVSSARPLGGKVSSARPSNGRVSSARPSGGKVSSARPMGIMAPTPGMLKSYIKGQEGRSVKTSMSPNSIYSKFTRALSAKPSQFKKIVLITGYGTTKTAYIPKVAIAGLKMNTAYVMTNNRRGQFLSTVTLPMF